MRNVIIVCAIFNMLCGLFYCLHDFSRAGMHFSLAACLMLSERE